MSVEGLLKKGAAGLGVPLSDAQAEQFVRYLKLLKKWSARINLTSVTGEEGIAVTHFLDSISAVPCLGECRSLLDIGSGAGFPGIPVKIVRSETDVTLLDSSNKKVAFMREVIRELRIEGASALWGRAEDPPGELAGKTFDVVITRAVSSVPNVLKLSAPYIGPGGRALLMRGAKELEDSDPARYGFTEGLKLAERKEITLPPGDRGRVLLVYGKE